MTAIKGAPLSGLTVVVTRRPEQAVEFSDLLTQAGARVIHYPAVDISAPPTWSECDAALSRLTEYAGIIFTSMNSVEFFFRRAEERGAADRLRSQTLFAVGEKTRSVIESFGGRTEDLPETYTGAELARRIVRQPVRGKRFLFPKGNLAREELPAILESAGAILDAVTVYETTEPPFTEDRRKLLTEIESTADLLTFFSPSSVHHFVRRATLQNMRSKQCAVIGAVTADAAQREGLDIVLVAQRSTARSFAESIVRFYSSSQRK
ncbi:MAG: uroporphyrinogen-III synthase [Bacteroidota bacterium]